MHHRMFCMYRLFSCTLKQRDSILLMLWVVIHGKRSIVSQIIDPLLLLGKKKKHGRLFAISPSFPPKSKRQKYSKPCPYKKNCKYGVSCNYKHTDDEKEFFHQNMGRGNPLRKVQLCKFHPKCPKKKDDCPYAHGNEDAWCLVCVAQGHLTDNCPES